MTRLLTLIFTLNAIFFSVGEVCLCDMSNNSDYSIMTSSLSDTEKTHKVMNSDNCCDESVCTDNCMGTLPLLSSINSGIIFNCLSTPRFTDSHFYQLYLSVSYPPPIV